MVLVHHDGMLSRVLRGHIPKLLKFTEKYPEEARGPAARTASRWTAGCCRTSTRRPGEAGGEASSGPPHRRGDRPRAAADAARVVRDRRGRTRSRRSQTRRAGLVDYVLRVYRYYASEVDVHATDRAEHVTLARGDGRFDRGHDRARRRRAPRPGTTAASCPSETDEVRVYLHGGDDRVTRTGPAGGPIHVRVIAGGGEDVVDDSKSGGTDVWRDAGTVEVARGQGTNVRSRTWTNPAPVKDAPWLEPRSFGHRTTGSAIAAYHPDIELVLGYGLTRTAWGFRTQPYSSRADAARRDRDGRGDRQGRVRRDVPPHRLRASGFRLDAFASDIEQFNFFGYGNDAPERPPRRPRTGRSRRCCSRDRPSASTSAGGSRPSSDPEVRYSKTPTEHRHDHRKHDALRHRRLRAGGGPRRSALRLPPAPGLRRRRSTSPRASPDTRATSRSAGSTSRPRGSTPRKAWDVTSQYGGADGVVAAYAGTKRRPPRRARGRTQAVGRRPLVRGGRTSAASTTAASASRRFIGNSSLFGSVSLRGWLGAPAAPARPRARRPRRLRRRRPRLARERGRRTPGTPRSAAACCCSR